MPFPPQNPWLAHIANWAIQQAPRVQHWWDENTSDLPAFVRQDWNEPLRGMFDPVFQNNINNLEEHKRLREQLDWLDKRPYPEETIGFNPHQKRRQTPPAWPQQWPPQNDPWQGE